MQSNLKMLLWCAGAVVLVMAGYTNRGWGGFWLAMGAVVFFALLYFTRIMRVLRVASNTPKGRISSAVMLNARLKEGMTLLEVIQQTRALSEPQGELGATVELHRWTDPGGSWVDCRFEQGRLRSWTLTRPEGNDAT